MLNYVLNILNLIPSQNEAQVAMDERNKAENELLKLREQLKQKVMTEEIYKTNLKSALEKNSNLKV